MAENNGSTNMGFNPETHGQELRDRLMPSPPGTLVTDRVITLRLAIPPDHAKARLNLH